MKKLKGFTLVELVITIAIVIILSVVSVPIYRGYTDKAKMSEGYALLGLIITAQKSYFSEYGNFLDDTNTSGGWAKATCKEDVLGIDARGNKYFTAFYIDTLNTDGIKYGLYSFRAGVVKPENLRNIEGKSMLYLYYDITSGATFSDKIA